MGDESKGSRGASKEVKVTECKSMKLTADAGEWKGRAWQNWQGKVKITGREQRKAMEGIENDMEELVKRREGV